MDTQPPQNPATDISPCISQPLGATAGDGAEAALADTSHRSRNRVHRVKWGRGPGPAPGTQTTKKRKAVTFMKWGRAFAPALLLVAGLTPVWVAAAASVIAAISYVAYNKPFLWATRIR